MSFKGQRKSLINKLLEEYALYHNHCRKIENDLWKINRIIQKPKDKIQKIDPEKLRLRKEALEDMTANVKDKLGKIKKDLEDLQVPLDKHITRGSPPNNAIHLPLVDKTDTFGRAEGLELEGMLKGMVKVIQNQHGYDLYKNNCSAAVATVIYGGIPASEKTLRKQFKAEGFLGIATPQTVYNAAIKGQHHFYSAHLKKSSKNILEKFIEFLNKMVDAYKQKPKHKK